MLAKKGFVFFDACVSSMMKSCIKLSLCVSRKYKFRFGLSEKKRKTNEFFVK